MSIVSGREVIHNIRLKSPLPEKAKGQFLHYIEMNGMHYLEFDTKTYEIAQVTTSQQQYLNEVAASIDYVLIRLNKIQKSSANISFLQYGQVMVFDDSNKLQIIVGSRVELDLIKLGKREDGAEFFKQHFLADGCCLGVIPPDENSLMTLIGDKYICKFIKNGQRILEAVSVSRRNNNIFNDNITLMKGNIQFVGTADSHAQLSKRADDQFNRVTQDNASIMKLWSIYGEAQIALLEKEIKKAGQVSYNSYTTKYNDNDDAVMIFKLDKCVDDDFLRANIGYAVVSKDGDNELFISDYVTASEDGKTLTAHRIGEFKQIPLKGILKGTMIGTDVSKRRQDFALADINNGKAPMPGLKLILQNGQSQQDIIGNRYQPVNPDLIRKVFGGRRFAFTEQQKDAISAAINTPDIALIQGPPGTGKTTVIKAIIARLNKIGAGNLRILVTSAQHDAVDNAVDRLEYGGLPANRIGGRHNADDREKNKKIQDWVYSVQSNCDTYLAEHELASQRNAVRSIIRSMDFISNIGVSDNLEIILAELQSVKDELSALGEADEIIRKINGVIINIEFAINKDVVEDEPLYKRKLRELISQQRITAPSFLDDGVLNLRKLIALISIYDEIDFDIPDYWEGLLNIEEISEELERGLYLFSMNLDELQHKVLNDNKEELKGESLNVDEVLTAVYRWLELFSETKKDPVAQAIWDFKERLNSPSNVKHLIKSYAKVNAATCQQSALALNRNQKGYDRNLYDFVIIDEAARVNPRDLIIPMSMGRKVILVGDHKQLPHLLEREIVEEVERMNNDPETRRILSESLFSRMFNMVRENSTLIRKNVMLKEQYRMHPLICEAVNQFYGGELESPLGEEGKLHNLGLYDGKALAWIDIGLEHGTEKTSESDSTFRSAEVEAVQRELNKILPANPEYSIGIISFYSEQVAKIKSMIQQYSDMNKERISVGTVDSFQGKEFDIVVLSMVRSNNTANVGFVNSPNRLNVAFSRAKRLLVCIGDSNTVARKGGTVVIESMDNLLELCRTEGYYEKY